MPNNNFTVLIYWRWKLIAVHRYRNAPPTCQQDLTITEFRRYLFTKRNAASLLLFQSWSFCFGDFTPAQKAFLIAIRLFVDQLQPYLPPGRSNDQSVRLWHREEKQTRSPRTRSRQDVGTWEQPSPFFCFVAAGGVTMPTGDSLHRLHLHAACGIWSPLVVPWCCTETGSGSNQTLTRSDMWRTWRAGMAFGHVGLQKASLRFLIDIGSCRHRTVDHHTYGGSGVYLIRKLVIICRKTAPWITMSI